MLQTFQFNLYRYNYLCVSTDIFIRFDAVTSTEGKNLREEAIMDFKTEVNPADGTAAGYQLGPLHFGSNWRPTSPKFQELKARHEEHHSQEFNTAHSELKIV